MITSSRASRKSSPTKGGSLPASGGMPHRGIARPRAGIGTGEGLQAPTRRLQPHVPRWKRRLDLALVILAAPLWAPIIGVTGLLIKLISPGPIFYRQERVGLGGAPFMIMKFRSMKVNAETQTHEEYVRSLMKNGAAMQKLDNHDPRLIPLGRLMRASGLDELPQIFNVIVGEMSIVGPDPVPFSSSAATNRGRKNASTPSLA
jgi:lipopolysaccharide/colanic/teichoic acid biosynthesis glycosyltransferase